MTSTKQFVWCGNHRSEARDAVSTVTAQYFRFGEVIGGAKYYFIKDQLGSIREVTGSGGLVSEYVYDPFGKATILLEQVQADLQYAGYYYHAQSKLNLCLRRNYSSSLGRWINRDPIGEKGGNNLYKYVSNNVTNAVDPNGTLMSAGGGGWPPPSGGSGDREQPPPGDDDDDDGDPANPSNPKPCDDDDPCKKLLETVEQFAKILSKKYNEMREDQKTLYENAHFYPNASLGTLSTWVGHLVRAVEARNDLNKSVKEAEAHNCKIPEWIKKLLDQNEIPPWPDRYNK